MCLGKEKTVECGEATGECRSYELLVSVQVHINDNKVSLLKIWVFNRAQEKSNLKSRGALK